MKLKTSAAFLAAMMAVSVFTVSGAAKAEEVKMVGVITKITVAEDGNSAVAVLKDNKTGDKVTVNITDDLTLNKFKDHRIIEGDEIRTKYDNDGGKNLSTSFLKTAGC
jgi:hypothetical protein